MGLFHFSVFRGRDGKDGLESTVEAAQRLVTALECTLEHRAVCARQHIARLAYSIVVYVLVEGYAYVSLEIAREI